jgi:hypothetical protein
MECECFHHDMPSSFADEVLRNKPPGSFLIRFSGRSFGHLCVSKVTEQRRVVHHLVAYNLGTRQLVLDGRRFCSLLHMTAVATVDAGLRLPCPRSSDVDSFVGDEEDWEEEEENDLGGYLSLDSVADECEV